MSRTWHRLCTSRAAIMLFRGIDIGRLFGIRISLDWSLIVIFLLVSFNLGAGVFPLWHPDWSVGLTWSVAIGAAVLFFFSILVHELAHALVARAYQIPVRRITLFLFGGVADMEHEPRSPAQEALMAGVGPITSIGLGLGFSVLAGAFARVPAELASEPLRALRQMGPIATLFAWLGPINVLVGVFNLLPAFPLDGGRVLRAGLWAISRNLESATRWASRIGQSFGWLLIVTGIAMAFGVRVPYLGTGFISGIWLAFIGWFLSNAAAASYRQLVIKKLLEDVPIARLARRELPPSLEGDLPLSALIDEVMRTGKQTFPVLAEGRFVGLVNARDASRVPREQWNLTPIREIAKSLSEVPTAAPEDDAYEAVRALGRDDTREIAVVDRGELVGIVRAEDVARWLELQLGGEPPSSGAPVWRRFQERP